MLKDNVVDKLRTVLDTEAVFALDLVKSLLMLGLAFGLSLSDEQLAAIMAVLILIASRFTRSQVYSKRTVEGLTTDVGAARDLLRDQLVALVPEGTVAEVLAWVDGSEARAEVAYEVEQQRDNPRKTLVEALNAMLFDV